MILLEVHNRIIEEVLTLQIESFLRGEKLVEIKTNIVGKVKPKTKISNDDFFLLIFFEKQLDFDGALYNITCGRDTPFTVSIKLKFFRDLQQHGTDEVRCNEKIIFIIDFFFSSGSST